MAKNNTTILFAADIKMYKRVEKGDGRLNGCIGIFATGHTREQRGRVDQTLKCKRK
jgi:hypothetical protein